MEAQKKEVTFIINADKEILSKPNLKKKGNDLKANVQQHPVIEDFEAREIIYCLDKPHSFTPGVKNGFVGTAFEAYCKHYNLRLRPDDVWIAIAIIFGKYIEAHAESMRKMFVDHEEKEKLTIIIDTEDPKQIDWESAVETFSSLIEKKTKADIKEWFISNFSTTTPLDRFVSQIALMGGMRQYFQYEMLAGCGIPSITLEGTLEDWQEIRTRVDKIRTYDREDLTEWSLLLGEILDQFVAAYQGKVDKNFWNAMIHYEHIPGDPEDSFYDPDRNYLSGWILAFAPFDTEHEYIVNSMEKIKKKKSYGRVEITNIQLCAIEVPVTFIIGDTKLNYILYGGMMMSLWDDKKEEIRPSVDYVIIDDTKTVIKGGKMFEDDVLRDEDGNVVYDNWGEPVRK